MRLLHLITLLVLCSSLRSSLAIKWLALSKVSAIAGSSRDPAVCDQMKDSLVKKQVKFCKRNPGFMDSVRMGAVRAIDECQYQFRSRRWNCSSMQDRYNQHVNFIRGQLGTKLPQPNMQLSGSLGLDGGGGGYPSISTSSIYTRDHLVPSLGFSGPYEQQPKVNAVRNAYRNRRQGRRRNNRRARRDWTPNTKARRNTEEVPLNEIQQTENTLAKGNMTVVMDTQANAANARDNKKRNLKKWQAALGPYPVVSPGTREASFVHAISSAGVAHAVTRACSSGELENCGCDRSLWGMSPEGFQWSGCSDNVDFGVTFSRTFVDAQDRRKSRKKPKNPISLMNLHNNEAGRKMLEKNMKVECKCHGVSGSCELKTCWRSLASFRMIGAMLKDKFDGAQEVRQRRKNGRRMLIPKYYRAPSHTETDLVYLVNSPDYCDYDVKRGSLGTRGRECDPTSKGVDGCDLLCCNRGYTTRRERRQERCHCKFHWCCNVECQECVKEVQISTCN